MQMSEPAEYAILGLIESQPMHGYEMFQEFESGTLGQIVHLEMSQMYAFLKKLERLQYIEAELEPHGTRPLRKVFHLLPAGHDAFFQWLTEPVLRPREVRILFLLKLYFAQHLAPERIDSLIDQQIAACQRFLDNLEGRHAQAATQGNESFFDHVVLRGRIYQTRSLLDWLNELHREMANQPSSRG